MNFRISIVQRYLAREILLAVALVLLALLVLYTSFDFINEVNDVGKNGYRIEQAALFVLLQVPARAYELLPIAALIGTIYALAQLASHSEFTILRVAGLSTSGAVRLVMVPGLALVAFTFLLGEIVTPRLETFTQTLSLKGNAGPVARGFRSGLWVKDNAKTPGGEPLVRFVNIGTVGADNSLQNIKVYEFDAALRLQDIAFAERGSFVPPRSWRLSNVTETRFINLGGSDAPDQVEVTHEAERLWQSDLNPQLLAVLTVTPERMAATNLDTYIKHPEENKQTAERYQIAFWKKIIYPFAVLVMMALALPFAYLHFRSGGISFKIFTGIMLGIGFYLLNNLFSHVGLLNTWPPIVSAAMPSVVVLACALVALRWVERAMTTEAMVLFGHGARDPRWAEPFERLRDRVAARRGAAAVSLAYLELMTPDLDTAVDVLVARGYVRVVVVPIFFGQGAHLRRDLPALVDALRTRLPAIEVVVAEAAGEDEAVLAAVAEYCERAALKD